MKVRLQASPDEYAKVSMHQILEASKRLFQELADETRAHCSRAPSGTSLQRMHLKGLSHALASTFAVQDDTNWQW